MNVHFNDTFVVYNDVFKEILLKIYEQWKFIIFCNIILKQNDKILACLVKY